MNNYSRLLLSTILIISCLLVFGCQEQQSDTLLEVREAMKEFAPPGGSGVKSFNYESGELKVQNVWSNYSIQKIIYYDRSGATIYESKLDDDRQALLITLNEDGKIEEIIQTKELLKHGACFVFENGALVKIQSHSVEDGMISEYLIQQDSN
ncbi:MAG: hypothetical protein COA78_03725 [Blastopirellula sp.]|nr:MAG: hypothetical protein COA78_03725 [Blastopirellula sp.]